jgi:hypothetical protein
MRCCWTALNPELEAQRNAEYSWLRMTLEGEGVLFYFCGGEYSQLIAANKKTIFWFLSEPN